MQIFTEATASFDASHMVKAPLRCNKDHGHSFEVVARVQGDYQPEIQEDLEVLLRELDGRSLNAMMIAGDPSVTGTAAWIMERLLHLHPRLVLVRVMDSKGLSGICEREIR